MSTSWDTKWGPRRVRRDPPTLAEAIAAARGLSDEREQQVEIAAALIGTSAEAVRAEMLRLVAEGSPEGSALVAAGRPSRLGKAPPRAVVVERRFSRRVVVPMIRTLPAQRSARPAGPTGPSQRAR